MIPSEPWRTADGDLIDFNRSCGCPIERTCAGCRSCTYCADCYCGED